MELIKELEACINLEPILKRRLKVLGIITTALTEHHLRPVLVGGCAVEFYTLGGYATYDIDIVVQNYPLVDRVLIELGFTKNGRHWTHDALDIFIEIPSSTLEDETAPLTSVQIDGFTSWILGIEDLIIDRLNAAVHWQSGDDRKWSKELIQAAGANLDIPYLIKRAETSELTSQLKLLLEETSRG